MRNSMKELDAKDKILILALKNILKEKFGKMIVSIHCYGSRITQGKKDSDFDILLLTEKPLKWREQRKIKYEIYDFGIEHDIVFDPKIFSNDEFENQLSFLPFIKDVKTTGILI